MKSWKWKLLLPVITLTLLVATKYILWDFAVSSGKRVGNLTKISKKGNFYPTWEGTLDEGSGEGLVSQFSVQSDSIGEELYNYEGRKVIVYYEQYLVGWPRDTTYNIVGWKPKEALAGAVDENIIQVASGDKALNFLSKTLFCSLLGTLFTDQALYQSVKEHVKKSNIFLYNQFDKCNT